MTDLTNILGASKSASTLLVRRVVRRGDGLPAGPGRLA